MAHHPGQTASVGGQQAVQLIFNQLIKWMWPLADGRLWFQQACAEHRRQAERDKQRDQQRHGERHGKLAEQPPDNAAHQQDRDEHRDKRHGHRQHGETHLLRPAQRRPQRAESALNVPRDVLQHHNCIIHHEAGGDNQRHQRQVIQAVTQQVHHRAGADQRHRQRQGRNDHRLQIAQENKHHRNHEQHRDQQRLFGVIE